MGGSDNDPSPLRVAREDGERSARKHPREARFDLEMGAREDQQAVSDAPPDDDGRRDLHVGPSSARSGRILS